MKKTLRTTSTEIEQKLKKQNEYLKVLHETTIALMNNQKPLDVLNVIINHAAELVDTQHGYIYLTDDTTNELTVKVGLGIFSTFVNYKAKKGEGLAGKVWEQNKTIVIEDYDTWPERLPSFPHNLFHAAAAIPLRIGKDVIAIIALVYDKKGRLFQKDEIDLLKQFTEIASISLDNSKLYQKLQQEIRERSRTEERYRAFVAHSSEGIWRAELEKPMPLTLSIDEQLEYFYQFGYMAECNDAMAKMYGFTKADDIVGAKIDQLLIRDDPKNIEYLTAFIQSDYNLKGAVSHEVDIHGKSKYFQNSLVGIKRNGKLIRAWGTQIDITERKMIEQELKSSKEQLEIFFQNIADGITIQDSTGNLIYANQAAATAMGYRSVDTLLATPVREIVNNYDLIDEKGKPLPLEELPGRKAMQGKMDPEKVVGFRIKKTGERHWSIIRSKPILNENKKLQYIVNVFTNITERKKIEKDLRISGEKFRTMFEQSPLSIQIFSADGKTIQVNKAWEKLWGLKMKDISGHSILLDKEHEDDGTLEYIKKAFQGETIHLPRLKYVPTRGPYKNKELWTEFFMYPVKDKDNNVQEIVLVHHDITSHIELDRKREEFISIASHELKTPLTSVKAFTQLLQKHFDKTDDAKAVTFLNKLDNQVDKLTNLVSDLLDTSKLQTGKLQFNMEKFDLTTLVTEIVEDIQPTTTSHKIIVSSSGVATIKADKFRIGQVITNFLTNAIKYSPDSDKVNVEVKVVKKYVLVCVADFGFGIPEGEKEKIFERFYRTETQRAYNYPGLGLGLYISAEIVKRHNGKIWVESPTFYTRDSDGRREGRGSTFYFSLPIK